jgi:D-aminoacyl-tRNA deacylase
MRIVVQRVKCAAVRVDGNVAGSIERGFLLLVGIGAGDTRSDIERLAQKIVLLRIFEDEQGKMNRDIKQAGGAVLSVPQFTLYADVSRGNRPGFDGSALPAIAQELWEQFNQHVRDSGVEVKKGVFGAHMEVELINDGPVTICLDSKG